MVGEDPPPLDVITSEVGFVLRDAEICERAIVAVRQAAASVRVHEVLIRPYRRRRSVEQNRLYWALLNELAESTPYSAEAWHEHFKREYIGLEEIVLPGGRVETRGISTTTLSVEDFGDYVTRIQAFMSQHIGA